MTSRDDAALLQAVALRDEAAFAELYDRLARPVFSLVVRVLRSRAEAEEVLQEAFWQVWERAADFRVERGSPFAWVVTIARRKAIDRRLVTNEIAARLFLDSSSLDTLPNRGFHVGGLYGT